MPFVSVVDLFHRTSTSDTVLVLRVTLEGSRINPLNPQPNALVENLHRTGLTNTALLTTRIRN